MKKILSVFSLIARGSIYKLFVIIIAMAGCEFFLFNRVLNTALAAENMTALEGLITQSRIGLVFAGFFLLTTAALCLTGCDMGGRQNYTLKRLPVSPRAVYFIQAAYNFIAFTVLLAAQAIIAFGLCKLFTSKVSPEFVSNQTLFLAFYRSPFLHSLIPLSRLLLWFRNLVMLAALALSTARFPVLQRQGKFAVSAIIVVVATLATFVCSIEFIEPLIVSAAIFVLIITVSLTNALRRDEYDNA